MGDGFSVKFTIKRKGCHKSNPFYHSLFHHHSDCIVHFDLLGNILNANPATVKLLGYSTEESKQMQIQSIIAQEDVGKPIQYFYNATPGYPQEFEEAVLNKAGEKIDLSVQLFPIRAESNFYYHKVTV